MGSGSLAGFPVVDVKATLYDGSYHDVDSSVLAFQVGGIHCFLRQCGLHAGPAEVQRLAAAGGACGKRFVGGVVAPASSSSWCLLRPQAVLVLPTPPWVAPLTAAPCPAPPRHPQIAARMAFREGMKKAGVQLLEPIMKVRGKLRRACMMRSHGSSCACAGVQLSTAAAAGAAAGALCCWVVSTPTLVPRPPVPTSSPSALSCPSPSAGGGGDP